jgi:phytoene dehydrogenase-like protein
MNEERKIVIIGAGVSGLTAALELEKNGFSPTILEASDRVGGRVKTDYEDGYQYDHGFQVLLTAYPEVSRYLDLKNLNLKHFKPGAIIYKDKNPFLIVDPLRQPSALFTALFSPVGSLMDKLRIWRLANHLKSMSLEEIFKAPSTSTMSYLRSLGFSNTIISNFFQPFFSGIFLESKLETSSRMFQFIFKMFSEGYAAIPDKGMQAIPNQLKDSLKRTTFHFNTTVNAINENSISTSEGDYEFGNAIIATAPNNILKQYKGDRPSFKSTYNLYFSTDHKNGNAYVGLLPTGSQLINNITVLTDVSKQYAPAGKSLLSISVVGSRGLSDDSLIQAVSKELTSLLQLSPQDIQFLKLYMIPEALPDVEMPSLALSKKEVVHGNIYLAGDYLLGGSLNAAMASGRQCVEILIKNIDSE